MKPFYFLMLSFLAMPPTSYAQPFKNLVFEGGGMRGISFAGAVSIAAERVGPKIKKFSEIDRDRLIANGRLATQEFLKTKGLGKK